MNRYKFQIWHPIKMETIGYIEIDAMTAEDAFFMLQKNEHFSDLRVCKRIECIGSDNFRGVLSEKTKQALGTFSHAVSNAITAQACGKDVDWFSVVHAQEELIKALTQWTSTTARNNDGARGYPGAKDAPGVFQTIVNNIPPHDVWIEAFAGSASVTRQKRRAQSTILIDSNAAACASLRVVFLPKNQTLCEGFMDFQGSGFGLRRVEADAVQILEADAVEWLKKNRDTFGPRTVIYCDPPYLDETLAKPGRRYYAEDFGTVEQHTALLVALGQATFKGAKVLISGRVSDLYRVMLPNTCWRRVDYGTATRGGPVTESLWCSFPEPQELHDWRFLGSNFRERERIKRKLARWTRRLERMPVLERRLVAAALLGMAEGKRI